MTPKLTAYNLSVFAYSVVPSGGGSTGKSPLIPWGAYQHLIPELEDVQRWEQELKPSLWGIVTGAISCVVVVDIDKPELRAIFDEAGLLPHIQTPRGGYHYWFRHPGHPVKTVAGLLPGIDIRGDGGFVNVLGKRRDGEYRVLIPPSPDEVYDWERLPKPIAQALNGGKPQPAATEERVIGEGERNAKLASIAGGMRRQGLTQEALEAALVGINQAQCAPPLDENEVIEIARSIARYSDGEGPEDVTNTDVGNAARLCRQYGDILHYCYEARKWLVWNGKYWEWDLGAQINRYATLTVKGIYHEAAEAATPEKSRELAKHAMTCESNHRIVAMICRAESQDGIAVKMATLDTQDWLLNCPNGTVDLKTGELLSHDPGHLITCMVDVDYDPSAKCPRFMKFIARVCGDDEELVTYLQRCVGYSLTGCVDHEVVYFIYGEGQNGKSTFLSAIRKLVGPYGWRINPDMFMTKGKNQSGPKESLANLKGKRFVVGSEVEEGKRFAMSLIKSTTGAETIQADRKYEHEIEWQPTHKLWLFGNYRPEVRDTTASAWRRLKLVPFVVKIPDSEKDTDLKWKLQAELPGILAWAVKGCLDFQRHGMPDPKVVTDATDKYRREQNVFDTYTEECCVIAKGESVPKAAFRADLRLWCISNNIDPFNTHQVVRLLAEKEIVDGSDGKRRVWKGIRLRTQEDPDTDEGVIPGPGEVDETDNTDKIKGEFHKLSSRGIAKEKFTENTQTNVTNVNSVKNGTAGEVVDAPVDWPQGFKCGNCKGSKYWIRDDGTKMCAACRKPLRGKKVFEDD